MELSEVFPNLVTRTCPDIDRVQGRKHLSHQVRKNLTKWTGCAFGLGSKRLHQVLTATENREAI